MTLVNNVSTNEPAQQVLVSPAQQAPEVATMDDTQFQEHLQSLEQQAQGQQPESQEEAKPQDLDLAQGVAQQQELQATVDAVQNNLEVPQQEQEAPNTEEPTDIDDSVLSKFAEAFKTKYNVSLEEAITSAQNMQGLAEQVQTMTQTLNARMQQMELMSEWNVTAREASARLQEILPVYQGLGEEYKNYIRQRGTAGLVELYNALPKNRQPAGANTVPMSQQGRATIAQQKGSKAITPELIAIRDDAEFLAKLAEMYPDAVQGR